MLFTIVANYPITYVLNVFFLIILSLRTKCHCLSLPVKFLEQKILSSCISAAVQSNDPVNILGSMGKDQGKLMYPCSLKIDDHGDIYIVDEGMSQTALSF